MMANSSKQPRLLPGLLIALWVLWLSPAWVNAATPIEVYEDVTASQSFEEVRAHPEWFASTSDSSPGFSDSNFWIRVRLVNQKDQAVTQVVQFHSYVLPKVKAYRIEGGAVDVMVAGTHVPFDERPIPGAQASFPYRLAPNSSATVWIKVASAADIALEYSVVDEKVAHQRIENFMLIANGIFAMLVVLFAYNLVLLLMGRSMVYLAYGVFLFASSAAFFIDSGLHDRISDHSLRGLGSQLAILIFVGALWFMHEIFAEHRAVWVGRLTLLIMALMAAHLLLPTEALFPLLASVSGPLVVIWLTAMIGLAWWRGSGLAPYVALGWSAYIIAMVVTALSSHGVLPASALIAYAFGSVVEGLVFLLVLAHRMRLEVSRRQLARG